MSHHQCVSLKGETTDTNEHATSESSDCESVSMSPETIATVVGKKP